MLPILGQFALVQKKWLDKSFEPFLFGFADGTDLGRAVAGAQVAADPAAPYRHRQTGKR